MREDKKDTGTKYDKSMVNRLARASGHLKSIRGMVEQGRDCSEVLIQLAAVRSAVNGAGKEVSTWTNVLRKHWKRGTKRAWSG